MDWIVRSCLSFVCLLACLVGWLIGWLVWFGLVWFCLFSGPLMSVAVGQWREYGPLECCVPQKSCRDDFDVSLDLYIFCIYTYIMLLGCFSCILHLKNLGSTKQTKNKKRNLKNYTTFLPDSQLPGVPSNSSKPSWPEERGALWAAQRVPSGHVAVVANSYLVASKEVVGQKHRVPKDTLLIPIGRKKKEENLSQNLRFFPKSSFFWRMAT